MTDRLEQIKTRGYFVGGARSERTQQIMEDFEWLLKDMVRLADESSERAGRIVVLVHENATLRLEADELRQAVSVATADKVFDLEREVATLREALRKHGIHSPKCQSLKDELQVSELPSHMHLPPYKVPAGKINCVCGLDEALAATEDAPMTDDRRTYPLVIARCVECAWTYTGPSVRIDDVRKAAVKHTEETEHPIWIDKKPPAT